MTLHPWRTLGWLAARSATGLVVGAMKRARSPWRLLPLGLGAAFFVYALAVVLAGISWAHPGGLSGVGGTLMLWAVGGAWMAAAARPSAGLSPAEAQILGAAPLTPRQVVLWRVLRAQPGLLAAASAVGIAAGDARLPHVSAFAGMLVLLEAVLVHQIAAALTVGRLATLGWPRWAQLLPAVGVVAALAAVVGASLTPVPTFDEGARVMVGWADELWHQQPAATALHPIRLLVLLPISGTASEFFERLPGALLVLAAAVAWLAAVSGALPEDASHEEVPDEADAAGPLPRSWPVPRLSPSGPGWRALGWRSVVELLRRASPRAVLAVLGVHLAAALAWGLSQGMGVARDPTSTTGGLVLAVILLGPTLVRIDLRADLDRLDTLRQLPVPGHGVVRGTGVGAVAACMAVEGALLAAVAGMSPATPAQTLATLVAAGCAALGATLLAFAIAAWMALAWPLFERRPAGPGGIEAVGALVAGTVVRNVLLWVYLFPAWVLLGLGAAVGRWVDAGSADAAVTVLAQGVGFGVGAVMVAELVIRRAGRRLDRLDGGAHGG